jgi:DNA-binding transcriptional LysR family regulator
MAATRPPGGRYWGVDTGPAQREIACFVRVAHHLNFSRAAAELGMSQPAVSQAVARLERALGVRLFERNSREVRLTDDGKLLLPYAEGLLEHVGAFLAEAARLAGVAGRPIRLAYCPLVGGLAARVARRLSRRRPAVEVELVRAGWGEATSALAGGAVSAAVMSMPFPAGLASTARFHVPLTHLAVPAGSSLAGAARLSLPQLAGVRLLMPRTRPPGSIWAALAVTARSTFVAADLDDLPAALDLVAAGRGCLVAPRMLTETVRRPDVTFVPLDTGGLRMSYGLVWPPDRASSDVVALVQAVGAVLRVP